MRTVTGIYVQGYRLPFQKNEQNTIWLCVSAGVVKIKEWQFEKIQFNTLAKSSFYTPLKSSENQRFSHLFKWYRKEAKT